MADEGVGPSRARAIQGVNGTWADFTSAAVTKPRAIRLTYRVGRRSLPAASTGQSRPPNHSIDRAMANSRPASPTRLVMKARWALTVAVGRSKA
jgi:hypothetical protein